MMQPKKGDITFQHIGGDVELLIFAVLVV